MAKWEEKTHNNGMVISRKVNKVYTAFRLRDSEIALIAKYNHVNKKDLETNFYSPLYEKLGTVIHLTEEEAREQHRGSIRYRLRLKEEISEQDALEKVFIPASIYHGLKPGNFPLKNGDNPFTMKDGPFLKGYGFHAFTNMHGETWVAYTKATSNEIWVSCNDDLIGWIWKKFETVENKYAPWVMSDSEKQWLAFIEHVTQEFHDLIKECSNFKK